MRAKIIHLAVHATIGSVAGGSFLCTHQMTGMMLHPARNALTHINKIIFGGLKIGYGLHAFRVDTCLEEGFPSAGKSTDGCGVEACVQL